MEGEEFLELFEVLSPNGRSAGWWLVFLMTAGAILILFFLMERS